MRGTWVTFCSINMLLAFPASRLQAGDSDLDKNGTGGCKNRLALQQTAEKQEPAQAGSFEAEGEGFEPSISLRIYRFSRPTHSTALPPLRKPCDEFGKMRTHRILEV